MKRTLLVATRALFLALVWSLANSAQRAHAAELRIEWTAPPECSSARELRARVMNLMGSAPRFGLLATVEVTRSASGYRAHVLIALSIPNPERSEAGHPLSLVLWPEARLSSGLLPLTAAGVGAAIAVEGLGSFRFELDGAYFFPQSTTFDETTIDQTRTGGQFELFTVGASICRLWSFSPLEWGPCVGAEVQHVNAFGVGGAIQRAGSTTWWGLSLGMFARAQLLPMFGMSIAVEGVVPMLRPQFVFSDVVGPLYRVGAVAFQLSVGPEVRF
jgi:hypothetical protein